MISILVAVAAVIAAVLWFGYRALRRYSCCGTCGCDLMTKKERKAFEARTAKPAANTDSSTPPTGE